MHGDRMNQSPGPVKAFAVRGISVVYGERRALDGVTLELESGTALGLLGPNGSGKSTLLSVLSGLRHPSEGEIRVLGLPPAPALRRRVGVVFQESCLDPLMTARETLALQGRLFGLAGNATQQRAKELLDWLGLAGRDRDHVRTLSGGLRRRLELARALLPSPELLLLDEPTSGLDPDSRRAFWEMTAAARKTGLALFLATNDVLEAERECDRVAFLHHGTLVASGTPAELKAGLRHDSVRVECHDGRATTLSQTVSAWPGVGKVTSAGRVVHVTVDNAASFVPRLFQIEPASIHTISIERSTLEDAYFQIAGAPLSTDSEMTL